MTNEDIRHIFVKSALEFLPPRIRNSVLDDQEFVEHWNLDLITGLTFGNGGPSFQRGQLFEGIRAAIRTPGTEVEIKDDQSNVWRLLAQNGDESLSFSLEGEEISFSIPDHSGLAEDYYTRAGWFARAVHEVNLEESVLSGWKTRIDDGPLNDNEFVKLSRDLESTPVSNYRNIHNGLLRGSVDIETLVPSERQYYNRLVGPSGTAGEADTYIDSEAVCLIDSLQQWDPMRGLLMSLPLCSKGKISQRIRIDKLSEEELLRSYEWMSTQGDPVSQIGAVEVALRDIERNQALEPFIEQIVQGFITDDTEDIGGCFSTLSSMIVLVASELSRKGIMKEARPFYRRQCAIAQASLIVRALRGAQADSATIVEWVRGIGIGYNFILQGLVDLRLEPRWLPDFVSPKQLRAEFIGRLVHAASQAKGKIQSESLRNLLIGEHSELGAAVEWPFPMLPGPLEGELTLDRLDVPDEIVRELTEGLEADQLEPASFAGIVNMALLYRMSASQAGLAAVALRRVRYSIENADDENSVYGLIAGLANVAAVTRATDLADTLRVLARVMRRKSRWNADPKDELRIAMIAAASYEGLEDWACFAGEWITELAYEVVERDSAKSFLSNLRRLVQIEPALARHVAVADAALSSIVR